MPRAPPAAAPARIAASRQTATRALSDTGGLYHPGRMPLAPPATATACNAASRLTATRALSDTGGLYRPGQTGVLCLTRCSTNSPLPLDTAAQQGEQDPL